MKFAMFVLDQIVLIAAAIWLFADWWSNTAEFPAWLYLGCLAGLGATARQSIRDYREHITEAIGER